METKKYQEFLQTSQSDSQVPSLSVKGKFLLILAKNLQKQKLNLYRFALYHFKTRVSDKYFVSYCL